VPVVSYLALRGRCRICGEPISIVYPVVEIAAGACYFFVALHSPDKPALLKGIFLASALIVVFFIDLRHMIIPDAIVLPGLEIGLLIAVFEGRFWDSVLGAAAGIAVFTLIAEMAVGLFGREGMGGGDVKLAGMIGAFVGAKLIFLVTFLSFLIGGIVVMPAVILGKRSMRDPIPFGPMLACGALITLLTGDGILEAYLKLWTL
ncbi:MAG: A24 family peptidase, partial [bacterium]